MPRILTTRPAVASAETGTADGQYRPRATHLPAAGDAVFPVRRAMDRAAAAAWRHRRRTGTGLCRGRSRQLERTLLQRARASRLECLLQRTGFLRPDRGLRRARRRLAIFLRPDPADSLAALADRELRLGVDGEGTALSRASGGAAGRQYPPAYRERRLSLHPADARTGDRPARQHRRARVLRLYPVGTVGFDAGTGNGRRHHSGLADLGRLALCRSWHAVRAYDRLAADPAELQPAALRVRISGSRSCVRPIIPNRLR